MARSSTGGLQLLGSAGSFLIGKWEQRRASPWMLASADMQELRMAQNALEGTWGARLREQTHRVKTQEGSTEYPEFER